MEGGWIGFIGVILGSLITGGVNWFLNNENFKKQMQKLKAQQDHETKKIREEQSFEVERLKLINKKEEKDRYREKYELFLEQIHGLNSFAEKFSITMLENPKSDIVNSTIYLEKTSAAFATMALYFPELNEKFNKYSESVMYMIGFVRAYDRERPQDIPEANVNADVRNKLLEYQETYQQNYTNLLQELLKQKYRFFTEDFEFQP